MPLTIVPSMDNPALQEMDDELYQLKVQWELDAAFGQLRSDDRTGEPNELERPDSPSVPELADWPLPVLNENLESSPTMSCEELESADPDNEITELNTASSPLIPETAYWHDDPIEIDDETLRSSETAEDEAFRDISQRFMEDSSTVSSAREEIFQGSPWLLKDGTIGHFATFQPNGQLRGAISNTELCENTSNKRRRAPETEQGNHDTKVKVLRIIEPETLDGGFGFCSGDWQQHSQHHEQICDDDQHHCSCGKSYSSAFRLREHIKTALTGVRYPCLICHKSFKRIDSLRRHEDNIHRDRKLACPGCRMPFRPDYLRSHLESKRGIRCKETTKELHLNTSYPLHTSLLRSGKVYLGSGSTLSWPTLARSATETVAGRSSRQMAELFSLVLEGDPRLNHSTTHNEGTLSELLPPTNEPCSLCGMPLGLGEQYLIEHITKHSTDFMTKPYRCDECQIGFAFEQDLRMHKDAASQHSSCGFYHRGDSKCGSIEHPGHHPPSEANYADHKDMQGVLWAWEICQLRIHRLHISRLLNARRQTPTRSRLSLDSGMLDFFTKFSRLSLGSLHSFHSVPAWLRYQEQVSRRESDGTHLQRRKSLSASDSVSLLTEERGESILDSSQGLSVRDKSAVSTAPLYAQNAFYEQLQAKNALSGMWSKASGVRYRAKAATRYLLPGIHEVVELESSCPSYTVSVMC